MAASPDPDTKYSQVEIDLSTVSLERLSALGMAVDHNASEGKSYVGPASQHDLSVLSDNNIPYKVHIDDLAKWYSDRLRLEVETQSPGANAIRPAPPKNFKLGSFGGNLSFSEIAKELDEMRTLYPNLISVKFDLGKSRENRSIWGVRLSNQPDLDQNRPRVSYDGLIHAREPAGMMNLMYFMWHLLENYATDPNVKKLLDNLEIYVVPCTNPDGYEYNRSTNPDGGGMWRKNRSTNPDGSKGVDLNRNFSTFWGDNAGSSGVGSSETYRGPSAFSEPETQAIRNFRTSKKFTHSLNHHSFANRVLTPYGLGGWPPNKSDYERIGNELTRTNGWQFGPTPVMLGYSVSGGAKDWGHEVAKEFAFGAELGAASDGFWPARTRIEPLAASVLDMNLALARLALPPTTRLVAPLRQRAPEFHADVQATGGSWNFQYQLTDTRNSWYLTVHDLQGKQYRRYQLTPAGKSIALPRSGFPGSLYVLDVKSCLGESCTSVYRDKLTAIGL